MIFLLASELMNDLETPNDGTILFICVPQAMSDFLAFLSGYIALFHSVDLDANSCKPPRELLPG